MTNEELKEALLSSPKNGYATLTPEQREEMNAYCKRYAAFMDACKTEREATAWTVELVEKYGFKEVKPGMQLQPGDSIFLYTDGVTEATNAHEELYGEQRLVALMNRQHGAAAASVCEAVKADVDAFAGEAEQFDDITMLCLTWHGPRPEEVRA